MKKLKQFVYDHTQQIEIWMLPFLLVICIPALIVWNFWPNKWFCQFWGWHSAPDNQGFVGVSNTGTCPCCGKKVLQDSQGNW